MSTYQQKPNSGSLFRNEKKEAETHADYRGSALIDGTEYWLDSWINESANGTKYMSVKFKPKDQANTVQRPTGGGSYVAAPTDLDDEVPFISSDISLEHRVG